MDILATFYDQAMVEHRLLFLLVEGVLVTVMAERIAYLIALFIFKRREARKARDLKYSGNDNIVWDEKKKLLCFHKEDLTEKQLLEWSFEMGMWFAENDIAPANNKLYRTDNGYVGWKFKNEDDAMLCKMTWG